MKTASEALNLIAEHWGGDIYAILEESILDSVVPGVCMNDGCEYTTDVEPDQSEGYCECCGTGSVKSALALALF